MPRTAPLTRRADGLPETPDDAAFFDARDSLYAAADHEHRDLLPDEIDSLLHLGEVHAR